MSEFFITSFLLYKSEINLVLPTELYVLTFDDAGKLYTFDRFTISNFFLKEVPSVNRFVGIV